MAKQSPQLGRKTRQTRTRRSVNIVEVFCLPLTKSRVRPHGRPAIGEIEQQKERLIPAMISRLRKSFFVFSCGMFDESYWIVNFPFFVSLKLRPKLHPRLRP